MANMVTTSGWAVSTFSTSMSTFSVWASDMPSGPWMEMMR